ncbi:GIY-YIG nuclease family protein [Pinirhizobacter sp.]|jgi:hypothetical protein|uniref:GIY-YIG nuclease family protein n=1 Tax=Pinirhizobacter sp. TaxID=2950432 RepID=UPI002F40D0BC
MKGFIYALKNRAYGDHLIKIGRTTRRPDDRARELYSGSTGVPERFDVALYCQVGNCEAAETRIHDILGRYRQNKSREFFVTSLQVAKAVIDRVCREINGPYGSELIGDCVVIEPSGVELEAESESESERHDEAKGSFLVPLKNLRESPTLRSELTSGQMDRLHVVVEIMGEVFNSSFDKWVSDFRRDMSVERELRIWEFIAKAYLRATCRFVLDEKQRSEIFALLLVRSYRTSKRVLREVKLKTMPLRMAEIVLEGYEDKPQPLIVSWASLS